MCISKPPFEMAFHFNTFVRPEDVDGFMIKPAGMLLVQVNPLFRIGGLRRQKEWNGLSLEMSHCDFTFIMSVFGER